MSQLVEGENNRLLPVKNVRFISLRSCQYCKCGSYDGSGSYVCSRPGGPVFDVGDMQHYEMTCDRFIKQE